MLGPLPRLHRLVVVAVTLLVGVASGAWVAAFTPLAVAVSAGAAGGALAGLLAAYLLLHEAHHSDHPRPIRVRR